MSSKFTPVCEWCDTESWSAIKPTQTTLKLKFMQHFQWKTEHFSLYSSISVLVKICFGFHVFGLFSFINAWTQIPGESLFGWTWRLKMTRAERFSYFHVVADACYSELRGNGLLFKMNYKVETLHLCLQGKARIWRDGTQRCFSLMTSETNCSCLCLQHFTAFLWYIFNEGAQ